MRQRHLRIEATEIIAPQGREQVRVSLVAEIDPQGRAAYELNVGQVLAGQLTGNDTLAFSATCQAMMSLCDQVDRLVDVVRAQITAGKGTGQ